MAEGRPVPSRPGRGAPRARLAEILRVDHAGELAAVHIYRGQQAVFSAAKDKVALGAAFADLREQEAQHLAAFDTLLAQRGVRPSLLTPLWRAAAFALGAGTALMGDKAAHACTDAVEEVIGEHYAGQIEELKDRDPALAEQLSAFRDDELKHQAEAVREGAREAPGYGPLSALIKAGCRAAIRTAEKI
ncbi:MAG: demethoxyubiquinone hydroxylase family protein [Caulobacteraceae bacterium]